MHTHTLTQKHSLARNTHTSSPVPSSRLCFPSVSHFFFQSFSLWWRTLSSTVAQILQTCCLLMQVRYWHNCDSRSFFRFGLRLSSSSLLFVSAFPRSHLAHLSHAHLTHIT